MGVIINEFEMIVEENTPPTPETPPAQTQEQPSLNYKPMDIHAVFTHEIQRELRLIAH